jgi:branched-chain amino acid aminotransferase
MALAREQGVAIHEIDVPMTWLDNAQEVFASSSGGGVIPVTQIDGKPVANGRPGLFTRRLYDAYWQAHERPEWNKAVKIKR